jgi:dienelactone hydrolase
MLHDVSLRHAGLGSLWIYLPEKLSKKPLPCILIPPAGNYGCLALDLDESDRPEHLPYVRAGFAVVAFALGNVRNMDKAPDTEVLKAARQYMRLDAGLVNAQYALDYIKKKLPVIDPDRVYMAGHSSAATNALCIAAREPRLKGCIAYAPGWTDLPQQLEPSLVRFLCAECPGYSDFLRRASPLTHATSLRCPLFLFHAKDDTATPIARSERFAKEVKKTNPRVTCIQVDRGGHYDSMIEQGIPQAIRWLKKMEGGN